MSILPETENRRDSWSSFRGVPTQAFKTDSQLSLHLFRRSPIWHLV
jgi:hypothetical protein